MSKIDRRDFLNKTGQGLVVVGAGAMGVGAMEPEAEAAGKKSRVVLVKGTDAAKMLRSAMKVFRGMGKLVKGKKVVLKPNMSFKNPASWGNNTNPEVAAAVAEMVRAGGAASIVAVDHTMGQAGRAIKACGVGPALAKVKGVQVISGHKKADYKKKRIPRGKQLKTTELPPNDTASD